MDYDVLYLCSQSKENLSKYKRYIKPHVVMKETSIVLDGMERYFKTFPGVTELNWDSFSAYLIADQSKRLTDDAIVKLRMTLTKAKTFEPHCAHEEVVKTLIELDYLAKIMEECEKVKEGESDLEHVHILATNALKDVERYIEKDELFVSADLSSIADRITSSGYEWRLDALNRSLGPLRTGNFVIVAARVEVGKTTFLASEISHMVEQTDGNILWFNNEEQGNKVGIRCFQAVLGMTTDSLWSDLERNQKVYDMKTKDQIKIYDFEDSSSIQRIEQILKTTKPALIIFDQIDKLKGFKAERKDLELKAIYQWAREIAKTYAPVIAVSQASGEAEGKTWLTMDMVDGSKTAKQGEADWILGIGKESDNTSRFRYFNICKNKLLGDSDTLPEKRHGSAKVMIRAEVARYEDL